MNAVSNYRKSKDQFFKQHPQSPLTREQKHAFQGLHYFPENPALDLTIKIEEFSEKEPFMMQTSTGDTQTYRRFGRVKFQVDGQEAALTIFESPHGYFLPFVDSQAGAQTYGAGRYLDPEILPDGRFHIDFNMAYNPYCAYNENWSCPLTPFENRIKVPIRAGEMIFK